MLLVWTAFSKRCVLLDLGCEPKPCILNPWPPDEPAGCCRRAQSWMPLWDWISATMVFGCAGRMWSAAHSTTATPSCTTRAQEAGAARTYPPLTSLPLESLFLTPACQCHPSSKMCWALRKCVLMWRRIIGAQESCSQPYTARTAALHGGLELTPEWSSHTRIRIWLFAGK